MTPDELETTDEGKKTGEDEIDTDGTSATLVHENDKDKDVSGGVTEEEKKEALDSFEITQECDPLTMDCKELQDEAQKLTKKSEALGNVIEVYDEDTPLFLKATEEKSKVDGSLTKIFDRAFGTCITPEKKEPEKPETEPENI